MKKILLLSLSLITLISCEKTTIEGCTEPMAINYNPRASVNNNSCDFTGDIIFYLDQAAGLYLYDELVQELTFYVNGQIIGFQYNNGGFYTSENPPNCSNNLFTSHSVFWSDNSYTTISWQAIDETGFVWFGDTETLLANECLSVELTVPIAGCTNPMAINYNPNATINNNSCDFTGDIIFYLDQAAGIYLYNEGVQELTFYIDGNNIGTQYNNGGFYTTQTPPNCFDNFFTTSSVYWSNNSYTTINWQAVDETGFIWYENTTGLSATECLSMQLTSKKLTVYQENN